MNGEAMKILVDTAQAAKEPVLLQIDGATWSTLPLHDTRKPVPHPDSIKLGTLTGLVDYVSGKTEPFAEGSFIHVFSPTEVQFKAPFAGPAPSRATYAFARVEGGFLFGTYLDSEAFIVAIQSLFVQTETSKRLLALLGSIKDEEVKISEDDGTSQTVTARAGTVLRAEVKAPNPIELSPYRTFREIEQPASGFVFRLRSGVGGDRPHCALFEADGGAWRIRAAEAVKAYLAARLPGVTIVS